MFMPPTRETARFQAYLRKGYIETDQAPLHDQPTSEVILSIYDAVVVDRDCCDSAAVIHHLRQRNASIPIVLLCHALRAEEHIRYLEMGIDYRFVRPFEWREVVCCLRMLVRRKTAEAALPPVLGNVQLLEGLLRNADNGMQETLRLKEQQLLEMLFQNSGQIISRDGLIEHAWGLESRAEYNQLEVYISFIRKKLRRLNANVCIRTSRGIGYSLILCAVDHPPEDPA